MPTHFYTLQLLQRNYQIAKKAHTIYAFGILEQDKQHVKGGQAGLSNWLWIKANKSTSLIYPCKHGTDRNITTRSTTTQTNWSRAVNFNLGVLKVPPFIKAVRWWVPEIWTAKPERKFKPYSIAPFVYPRTWTNYAWNSKTFVCNFQLYIAFSNF